MLNLRLNKAYIFKDAFGSLMQKRLQRTLWFEWKRVWFDLLFIKKLEKICKCAIMQYWWRGFLINLLLCYEIGVKEISLKFSLQLLMIVFIQNILDKKKCRSFKLVNEHNNLVYFHPKQPQATVNKTWNMTRKTKIIFQRILFYRSLNVYHVSM